MEEQQNIKEFTNTKLKRSYFSGRFISILVKYVLVAGIVTFAMSISAVIVPLFSFIYFFVCLFASVALVIMTFGLLLIGLDKDENPIKQIWDSFQKVDQEILPAVQSSLKGAVPIMAGIVAVAAIILIVLVSKGMGRKNPHSDRAKLIVSIVLVVLGFLLSLAIK